MKPLLTALAVWLVLVTLAGSMLAPQMRLTSIDDPRDYRIVVTDTAADQRYAWVVVEGCSAEATEDGVLCTNAWYGRTDREWWAGRKQTTVPFRDAPKGVILRFEAVIADQQGKALNTAAMITRRSAQ